jgi:glycosyltransferase involved in cell wall biosynthesis
VALRQGTGGHDFVARLREDRVETTEIRSGRRRYAREVRELTALLRDWRPDVVHTHVYHADIVGYVAARRAGVPVVATVHGLTGGSLKNRFYQWLDLQALKRVDGVVCVSSPLVARMHAAGIPRDRVHLVPNAHDGSTALSRPEARAILGFDDQAVLVGWIGRLSHEKGADRFVRVIDSVRAGSRGVVIGDGPERTNLERQIAATGAPVALVGARPDAARLVSAFDVLAITSRTEGLPMTVLHAMAAEVPVVATAVGALPDALGDSAGWLVEPTSESDFSTALREALADRPSARARAQRGRARLERLYSLDRWLDAMNRVYDQSAT